MTTEVEIVVGRYEDVVAVPVQAVTAHSNKEYVFIKNADGEFVSKPIKTGKSNVSFVAIKEGLQVGSVVALDAYQRGLLGFDSEDDQIPEVPEAEVKDPEVDSSEVDSSEVDSPEVEDSEVEDSEVEDSEVEDSEVEDSEVEDSEVEDPQAKNAASEGVAE